MQVPAIIWCMMLLASAPTSANEILGFRIGSTVEEARNAARQIKRELQDINLGGDPAVQMFVVSASGPQIGFCRGRLVMLRMDMSGSFHEFINAFREEPARLRGAAIENVSNLRGRHAAKFPQSGMAQSGRRDGYSVDVEPWQRKVDDHLRTVPAKRLLGREALTRAPNDRSESCDLSICGPASAVAADMARQGEACPA